VRRCRCVVVAGCRFPDEAIGSERRVEDAMHRAAGAPAGRDGGGDCRSHVASCRAGEESLRRGAGAAAPRAARGFQSGEVCPRLPTPPPFFFNYAAPASSPLPPPNPPCDPPKWSRWLRLPYGASVAPVTPLRSKSAADAPHPPGIPAARRHPGRWSDWRRPTPSRVSRRGVDLWAC
jgi:hypothetical protein